MLRITILILFFFNASLLSASENESDREQILSILHNNSQAQEEGDADKKVKYMQDTMSIVTVGSIYELSKADIRQSYLDIYRAKRFDVISTEIPVLEVSDSGDMAWAVYQTRLKISPYGGARPKTINNTSVYLFKKTEGKWAISLITESSI